MSIKKCKLFKVAKMKWKRRQLIKSKKPSYSFALMYFLLLAGKDESGCNHVKVSKKNY